MERVEPTILRNAMITVCLLVGSVYLPVLSARALVIDDAQYVTENPLVQNPSWQSARRFLVEVLEPSTVQGYYQPFTMISLMMDYYLGGKRDDTLRPFHVTNYLLHLTNTALIGILLFLLFGDPWIAAGVALLWAVHPVTVEPVAWITERKTLLATFFVLCSLISYLQYVKCSKWSRYVLSFAAYLAAVLSKPTTISLPLLLFLIDVLGPRQGKWRLLLLEKGPFLAIGGMSGIITFVSQSRTAVAVLPQDYGWWRGIFVILHNVAFYCRELVWPVQLSPFHPFPPNLGFSHPLVLQGLLILLAALGLGLVWRRRTNVPWAGMAFSFVAILPTMQVVGFSNSIAGDKYLYFPIVGLLLLLAYVLGNLVKKNTTGVIGGRYAPVLACLLLLAGAEAMVTRRYLQKWENSVSLHSHMLTIYPQEAYLHNGAGNAWMEERAYARAAYHYRRAVELQPHFAYAQCNLALVYQLEENTKSAMEHYHLALRDHPRLPQAQNGLGDIAFRQGDYGTARECYERAIAMTRDWWPPLHGLARLLAIHPDPHVRSPEQAVLLAERAATLTKYRDPKVLDTLALAYAAAGEFEKALTIALEACRWAALTPGTGEGIALDEIQSHVRLYRQKKAYTADACTVRE